MIQQKKTVNWEKLQRRIDSCRNMSDADEEERALDMLYDVCQDVARKIEQL